MGKKDPNLLPDQDGDFMKNYANDSEVVARFNDYTRDRLQQTRNNRRDLEEQWLDDLRLWSCVLDNEGYTGHSLNFVPELNNQVETSVERSLTALFPSDDPFVAVALKAIDAANAKKITAAVRYELEDKARLFTTYDSHLRGKIIFGTSVLKQTFEKKMHTIWTRDEKGNPKKSEVPKVFGVQVRPVDIFRWYVFPEVCANLSEAELQFEDQVMSRHVLDDVQGLANLADIKPITANMRDVDHDWVDSERMVIVRLSNALARYRDSVLMTEVWLDFQLTKNGPRVPCRAWIANRQTVVMLKKNPYWYQESPYLGSRYVIRPGGIYYGLSLPDKIRSMQYQMNDLMNQTMDSITYALNPIAVIDPALAGDVNSMKLRPGARWLGSPEGIQFTSFPDVSQAGLRAISEIRGQIAQFSDNTPGVAPQLTGKARSATQASIIQSSVGARSRVQSKLEENDVLSPLCKRTHILMQQYMKDEWIIRVQGADEGSWTAVHVKPADIVGEVDFLWKGQSEEEKTAVYTQQLLAFYQAALQVAQVMPGEIDLPALFIRVAKEGFRISDLDSIFKSLRDKKSVDPMVENQALKEEMDVDINNGDDDEMHIGLHTKLLHEKGLSDEARLQASRHIEKHQVQAKGKQDLVDARNKLQAMQGANQMLGPPGGGQNGGPGGPGGGQLPGGPQRPPNPMEGNHGQVPSSMRGMLSSVQT